MDKAVLFTMNEHVDDELEQGDINSPLCATHDYEKMIPIIYQTWKPGFEGGCPKTSTVYAEHQVMEYFFILRTADNVCQIDLTMPVVLKAQVS